MFTEPAVPHSAQTIRPPICRRANVSAFFSWLIGGTRFSDWRYSGKQRVPERIYFMQDYRALKLGPDGHITSRFDFWARDDEAAKEQARQVASGQDLELWRHDRKIAEWRGQRPTWLKIKRVIHSPN